MRHVMKYWYACMHTDTKYGKVKALQCMAKCSKNAQHMSDSNVFSVLGRGHFSLNSNISLIYRNQ
jgi:hypothetical protein